MSDSIIRIIIREVTHAFRNGNFTFTAFGKLWGIEHVNKTKYRVITAENTDCGIRFFADHNKLSFFMG